MDLNYRKGLSLIFFTAFVSGFSIFVNSFGVKIMDSSIFTFSKNIVVAILLFSFIILLGQLNDLKNINQKQWLQLVLLGLIGGSVPFLLFFKGLQMTTGQASAFIHKTIFIYITIFAIIFLKEKFSKGLIVGAVLLLIGNYLMIMPDLDLSAGHLLIIAGTIMWAAENTFAKYILKEIPGTIVAFGRMFFGSLFILAFLVITGKFNLVLKMTNYQYLWILLTSLFLLLYVFSYYNGLKHINVTTASYILVLGSPITTILTFLYDGAAISLQQSFGMLLILIGVVSAAWIPYISVFFVKLFGINQKNARN